MTAQAISRRYAKALMAVADGRETELDQTLSLAAGALGSSPGRRLFFNPTLSADAKQALVKTIFGDDEVLAKFFGVVIEHGRERLIEEIAQEFHQLVLAHNGYTEAIVETARELDGVEQQAAKAALDQFLGKPCSPVFRVSPALIGGARVRFGDRMIDATVAGELGSLRNRLMRVNQSEVSR